MQRKRQGQPRRNKCGLRSFVQALSGRYDRHYIRAELQPDSDCLAERMA